MNRAVKHTKSWNQRSKGHAHHKAEVPLVGGQGAPNCAVCRERRHYRVNRNGQTIEWCRCGQRVLPVIRLPQTMKPAQVLRRSAGGRFVGE